MTLLLDRLKRSSPNTDWMNSIGTPAQAQFAHRRADSFLFLIDRFKRSRSNALKPLEWRRHGGL